MTKTIAAGSSLTLKLARLYLASSNSAPVHFALCPQGGYATALAIMAALGCCGFHRLVAR